MPTPKSGIVFAVKVDTGGFIFRAPADADVTLPLAGTLLTTDGDGSQLKNLPGGSSIPWIETQPVPTAQTGSFTSIMCMMSHRIIDDELRFQGWLSSGSLGSASGYFRVPLPAVAMLDATAACMNNATYASLCAYIQGGSQQIIIAGLNKSTPAGQGQTINFGGFYRIMP